MRFVLLALAFIALLVLTHDLWPWSFAARFRRDVHALLARPLRPAPPVTDADLAPLPPLVQAYLRRVGAVGRPRVRNAHIRFHADMRFGPDDPWMPSSVDQYEFYDPPARLFCLKATRGGVPFDVYHRYVGDEATFRVRLLGLVPIVNQRGPLLTKSETVTLLNDVVILAPAAVLDLPMTWETTGERTVRATLSNAGHTVSAELTFDDAGDLVGFLSHDRAEHSGKAVRAMPWSTPLSAYRDVDGIRLASKGDANWIAPEGEWTYGRFEVTGIEYNVGRRG